MSKGLSRRLGPELTGVATLIVFFVLVEILIRIGAINVYVVPLPSTVLASFGRVIAEEAVLQRFLLTMWEALIAGVLATLVGVSLGVLLYRSRILRLAIETWIAAFAAAPLVLAYPLFLVIFGRSFNLTPAQQFWKVQFPAAVPTIFVGLRLGLIVALINVVGVEFLINFGGLGQLINELAERYDLPGTYAAICFVILISVCFFLVLERVEKWLRPAS
jgi:NitT/TauT family transport system permease protein